jgi:hypothetical protein
LNSVLNAMRDKSETGKDGSAEVQMNQKAAELCGDCAQSGRCMLNEQLKSKPSIVKKGPVVIRGQVPHKFSAGSNKSSNEKANEPINDLENWVPHNLPKLKHETCPFHQIRSVG